MGHDAIFTRSEAWLGGWYELAIEVGPTDDRRLEEALTALWSFPDIEGCYLDLSRDPSEQPRVEAGGSLALETRLCGVARIGAKDPIACSTAVVRGDGSVWLYFGLPMGSLGHVFPVGAFPFEDGGDLSWRASVDDWLCRLAEHVFKAVGFRLGLVGWTDGIEERTAAELLRDGIPQKRWCGYLIPEHESLRWYPPNKGAPMTIPR
jgi:hypothetical protein